MRVPLARWPALIGRGDVVGASTLDALGHVGHSSTLSVRHERERGKRGRAEEREKEGKVEAEQQ